MKNVMIYNIVDNKRRHANDELAKLFQAQIDNSLYYGWKPEDIILGTNFEFEYKGVKSYILTDICTFNIFNNKWYGMLELMRKGILDDDFWFHDQDNWQVNQLEFPDFAGEVAACTYVKTPEWNTGSIFVKRSAINILEFIVDSMKMNPIEYQSDENWLAYLRTQADVSAYLSTVNSKYCVGYTFLNERINNTTGPITCLGFMPNTPSYNAFLTRGLVPDNLINIFNTYKG
jgi:hypothetical protein